jgi:hypothetical protein
MSKRTIGCLVALASLLGCHQAVEPHPLVAPRPSPPATIVTVESPASPESRAPIEVEIAPDAAAPPYRAGEGAFEDALYGLENDWSNEAVDGELRRADPRDLVIRLRDGLRRSTDDPELETVIHWCAAPYGLTRTVLERKVVTAVCDRVATKGFNWMMGAPGTDRRPRERAVGVDIAVILERNPARAHTAKAWRQRMDRLADAGP